MLKVGDKAPAFKLLDQDKKEVSLEDYKGKNLVIFFFPFAFSSVCTTEFCSLRDNYAQYQELGAEIAGISIDAPFTLQKFRQEEGYPFPLLSDFNKEVSAAYDSLYETFPAFGYKGVSKRSSFVIDKEGFIRFAEVLPSPGDLPDFNAIQEVLKKV
jgi:peroxiredoxin